MFPECPKIQKSLDYSKFKKIKWNRQLDDNNFKKLLKENIKIFQLHKFPIIVTTNYEIIDGQHRFEVSKKLKSPIYYIVEGQDSSFEMVHSVNKAGRKHTLKDKIEMLYKAGDEGAKVVYNIYETYERKFDISVIASILISGSTGGTVNSSIDSLGKIEINNYDEAIEILHACTKLNIEDKYTQRVVFSFNKLVKYARKKPLLIVNQINKHIFLWNNPKTRDLALEAFIKCYNYNQRTKNKIKIMI
jgi:hypothetical protein